MNFGIIPDYRGLGLSKPFLYQIINAAKQEGVETLYLDVNSKNDLAVNLYKDIGFISHDNTFTWIYHHEDEAVL